MPIALSATTDHLLYVLVFLAGAMCGIAFAWTFAKRRADAGRPPSDVSAAPDVERVLRAIRTYM